MVQARGATPQSVGKWSRSNAFDRPPADDCHHIAPQPPSARTRATDPSAHRNAGASRALLRTERFLRNRASWGRGDASFDLSRHTPETTESTQQNSQELVTPVTGPPEPRKSRCAKQFAPSQLSSQVSSHLSHILLPIRQRRRRSNRTLPPIRRMAKRALSSTKSDMPITYAARLHWYSLSYAGMCVPVRPDSCRTMTKPDAEH